MQLKHVLDLFALLDVEICVLIVKLKDNCVKCVFSAFHVLNIVVYFEHNKTLKHVFIWPLSESILNEILKQSSLSLELLLGQCNPVTIEIYRNS